MGMDESIVMPVTLKMSDIEHQPGASSAWDAMPIDKMDVDEELNASGSCNVADNVLAGEEGLEIESEGSSESYAGMSSSSSESSPSGFEEAGPTLKPPENQAKGKAKAKVKAKAKAKAKASNHKIVSQVTMAAVENVEVAEEEVIPATIFDGGSELSDSDDDDGGPSRDPSNWVGVQDKTVEQSE